MNLVTILALAAVGLFQTASPVRNPDFEEGELNGAPPGWTVPPAVTSAGYTAVITDDNPATGKRCVVLSNTTESPTSTSFGNVMQVFDATPYRGQRVIYRARVRTSQGSRAQLWLRVDRGRLAGSFDNMSERPVTSTTWSEYRIEEDIAQDATIIAFGMILPQAGRAWLDSVAMEFTKSDTGPIEPPRAIAGRGLDNLVAFARLFGYVRYFHPSDEAAATDWDRFAIDGVRAIEAAATPQELATKLDALFRPVAPTLSVFAGTKAPPLSGSLSTPTAGAPRVTLWKHTGVAPSPFRPQMFQLYSSIRETRDAPGPDADPSAPLTFDLGGGVSARVPSALWTDDGTVPKSPKPEPPGPRTATAADRATRIADIIIAWNVFQHFYPYFDVVDTDWRAILRPYLSDAATVDEAGFLVVLRRLVAELKDGHGEVNGGPQGLVALPFRWEWIENSLVITRTTITEIQRGDVVTMVDGRPVEAVVTEREREWSSATPQFKRLRALANLAQGPIGSEIVWEVRTGTAPARTVRLRRAPGAPVGELKPQVVDELRPGVFYVDIDRATNDDWKKALPALVAAKAVIFDLRGYPRGSVAFLQHIIDAPVQSARWQIPVALKPDREGITFLEIGRWSLQPMSPRITGRLAFITDGRAISQAESFLGIVEHYKLADIVGAPTAGTNGNFNTFRLPGGYNVTWTGMRVIKHDGSRHHGVGILPTVPAARTIAGVTAGRDELIEKSIEVVSR